MVNIERKALLVTGAASGIGLETVRRLSRKPPYNPIYAVDINPSIHTVFEAARYPQVIPLEVDIRKGAEIADMFAKVLAETHGLDVIVNAAGIIIAGETSYSPRYDQDPRFKQQISDMNDANFFGQMYIMMRAEIAMESRGRGLIINVTSSKDYFPDPFRLEYMKSKMAFEAMSLDDARRLKKDGVRIVVVKPGNTKTHIDKGIWTEGSREDEMKAVQGFNDWWRRTFGNDPKNVAEVIYQIAEGKIKKDIVHVGFDAKLGYFLTRTVPGWRYMFFLGSYFVYEMVKRGERLRERIQR